MAMQRRCRKCLPEHSPDAFAMGTMPGRSGCCRSGNGRHGVVPMCRVWRVVPRLPRCPTPTVCRDGRSFQRTPSPDCVGNTLLYRGLVRRGFGHHAPTHALSRALSRIWPHTGLSFWRASRYLSSLRHGDPSACRHSPCTPYVRDARGDNAAPHSRTSWNAVRCRRALARPFVFASAGPCTGRKKRPCETGPEDAWNGANDGT